ncbi:MAG: DUF3011 domain-containing protein [Pseudomonadales bacterium]
MYFAFRPGQASVGILSSFLVSLVLAMPAFASAPDGLASVTCTSENGERQHCAGDTTSGVVLVRSTGSAHCLLGRNWGYDGQGVWVTEGCGGEFLLAGQGIVAAAPEDATPEAGAAAAPAVSSGEQAVGAVEVPVEERAAAAGILTAAVKGPTPALNDPLSEDLYPAWGAFDPGEGFLIGRNDLGELSMSAYALVRYMNQMGDDTFTDHLDREQPVDLRNDIYSHRVIVYLKGWMGSPKLSYQVGFWTVNATDQDALFGNIGYRFSKRFNLYAGIAGNPGSRSMLGSHPYWLGNDRVMADEYFRPYFTQGIFANGEVLPGLWYQGMIGNTSSTLGTTASVLDREFTYGGSLWWMPTTHEFGPRGAYGDWEFHEELATRFGVSYTFSPEERYSSIEEGPDNTALKLADSLNVFATGSLAPGVTVTDVDYEIVSVDAGIKYRGFFLQTEFYNRTLDNFRADGLLPVGKINDWGFYVQGSFYPIPQKLEIYAATSQIFGDEDAGFDRSWEYLLGMNYYPFNTRNHRLNLQVMDVNKSPVSSTFGYYTGGQDGTTVAAAFSIFF